MIKDIELLIDYGNWATEHLFKVFVTLSPEQFTQRVAGSYGSVRNTMVHIVSAEWGWIERCGGTRRGAALEASDYPTVESLRKQFEQVQGHMRDFLSTLRDEDVDRIVEFTLGSGAKQTMRLGELMHHAANHGVHHRGQVSLLLRELGYVPGNFDALMYYGRE